MTSIPVYMTAKHRECDDIFTEAESAVADNNWVLGLDKWQAFSQELAAHFALEEDTLFPEFEQATGMTGGPTQVMRMEHQQMRALVQNLTSAMTDKDKETFLGLSETLMVMMQQHNMKEEMMLYPMLAQNLSQGEELIAGFETANSTT